MLYPAELRAHCLQLTHCTALVAFFATGNCAGASRCAQFCAHPAEKSRPEPRPRTGERSATKLLSRRAKQSAPASTRRNRTVPAASKKCVAESRAQTGASASHFASRPLPPSSRTLSHGASAGLTARRGRCACLRAIPIHPVVSQRPPIAIRELIERAASWESRDEPMPSCLAPQAERRCARFTHVTLSQQSRKHSSGRIPVSANMQAIEASGSATAAIYRASS
jgi:hypothetical protein